MPLLDGIKCPVCGNEFTDGDDVVYYPDCGTPHHRECYKMAGHCVNAGLHRTGYNFYDENLKKNEVKAKKSEEPNKTTPEGFYIPKQEDAKTEGETPFSPFVPALPNNAKEYEGETLDGTSAKDFAAAVRTNTNRFMPLFKRFDKEGKKSGWNWGALIFGPYYLLFRKMYGQGIGLLCLQTAISYLGSYLMSVKAPKFTETMQNIMSSASGGSVSQLDMEAIQSSADFAVATKISVIMFAVLIVIRIITALFADRIYFNTIKNLVKDVNEKVKDGASFSAVPTMMNAPAQELDSDQMKALYLARRGGTSMMPALIGYLAVSLLQML